MTTPAEDRAEREGTPVLATTPFQLMRVASGNPMMMRLLDGSEILVRLATVDEAIRFQRDAVSSLTAANPDWDGPPIMTRERAAELVRPLSI